MNKPFSEQGLTPTQMFAIRDLCIACNLSYADLLGAICLGMETAQSKTDDENVFHRMENILTLFNNEFQQAFMTQENVIRDVQVSAKEVSN